MYGIKAKYRGYKKTRYGKRFFKNAASAKRVINSKAGKAFARKFGVRNIQVYKVRRRSK